MAFINCQFNFVFTSKYSVADANCQQHCNLPSGGGGGGGGGDSGGGPMPIIIVIVACLLFLLTGFGYCYWRRVRDADDEKDGKDSNIGWLSRKDKETHSQKTAKADDLSVNGHPNTVRRTIFFWEFNYYCCIRLNRFILYSSAMRSLEGIAMVERELIHLPGPPITVLGAGVTARNSKQDLEATARNRSDPDQRVAADSQGAEAIRSQITMNLTPRPLNRLMMMTKTTPPQAFTFTRKQSKASQNQSKRSNPLAQTRIGFLRMKQRSRHGLK
jgi:hypothetical protein